MQRKEDGVPGQEKVARLFSRSDFLKAAGAAGIGAAVGSNLLVREAFARSATLNRNALEPTDLTFSIVEQYRPFDLVADNFVELSDGFDSDSAGDYQVFAPGPERNAGSISIGGGALRVDGNAHFTLLKSDTSQRAPFAAVIVDVESLANPGTGPEDSIFAGLIKDENNYVVAWYNNRQKIAGFDAVVDGQVNGLGLVGADLAAPFRFAFVLNENSVVALVDEGEGFRPLLRRNVGRFIDMRQPANLAEYKNGFGARANPGGTIVLGGVEAGYYGQAGVRDPHVVTYADGTPYIKDNKVYLTFTNAGLAFFETAHWGVWRLDLDSYELEQVGNLFFQRGGMDAVLGDHAGHIVYDEERGRWIVSMSTWGNFRFRSVEVNYTTVPLSTNVLEGVHILQTQRLPLPTQALPTSAVGQWDPHIVRIRGQWYVAFVNASRFFVFYPALAKSPKGGDFTDLSLVGADASKNATEGPIIQKIGDEWYVLASNGDDSPPQLRDQYPIYDLQMDFVGNLNAPHPTNIPWPMVFPVPAGRGRTRYVLVTFNGTQYYDNVLGYGTHGDFFVMEAAETVRGYEFPPREAP